MYQGVVILNKEPGFTSFDVVAVCRGIFGQRSVGHTGTLDPMARGVLPVCLGRATKLSDLLTSSEKEYEVEMELGRTTDTDDCTGQLLTEADPECLNTVTEQAVREALLAHLGESLQVPPRYAAIKKDGKKLYEYARAGVEVEMPGRPVTIHEIRILEITLPKIRYQVRCSKGTYIRSLCRDVGAELGVGAVMTALSRNSTGGFSLEEAVTLDQLKAAKEAGQLDRYVRPMDQLLTHFPAMQCQEEGRKFLLNGNPLRTSVLKPMEDPARVQGTSGRDTESVASENGVDLSDKEVCRVYLDGGLTALYRYDAGRRQFKNVKMLLERGNGN